MLKVFFRRFFTCGIHTFFIEFAKAIKIQALIGSKTAFFSFSHCFGPLIGFWSGVPSTCIVYTLRTVVRLSTYGLGALSSLYHIPSFCGALYLSTRSKLVRVIIPLVCFILFGIHPIGNQVLSHSMYWLLVCSAIYCCTLMKEKYKTLPLWCFMLFAAHPAIISELFSHSFYWAVPVLIALVNPRSIFLQSLGSTLTAHAVGSVMWLYSYNLTPEIWHSLVAIIWLERLVFALGMTLIYYAVAYAKKILTYAHAAAPTYYLSHARRSS